MKPGNLADAVWAAGTERRVFRLGNLKNLAKHFAGSREIESAVRKQFLKRCQDIVRSVHVGVHGAEAVGKTFSNEALSGKVVTLVEFISAQYVKNTWVAVQVCRMKRQAIQQMLDSSKSSFRFLQSNTPHQTVNFITFIQQVLGEIASVL